MAIQKEGVDEGQTTATTWAGRYIQSLLWRCLARQVITYTANPHIMNRQTKKIYWNFKVALLSAFAVLACTGEKSLTWNLRMQSNHGVLLYLQLSLFLPLVPRSTESLIFCFGFCNLPYIRNQWCFIEITLSVYVSCVCTASQPASHSTTASDVYTCGWAIKFYEAVKSLWKLRKMSLVCVNLYRPPTYLPTYSHAYTQTLGKIRAYRWLWNDIYKDKMRIFSLQIDGLRAQLSMNIYTDQLKNICPNVCSVW